MELVRLEARGYRPIVGTYAARNLWGGEVTVPYTDRSPCVTLPYCLRQATREHVITGVESSNEQEDDMLRGNTLSLYQIVLLMIAWARTISSSWYELHFV